MQYLRIHNKDQKPVFFSLIIILIFSIVFCIPYLKVNTLFLLPAILPLLFYFWRKYNLESKLISEITFSDEELSVEFLDGSIEKNNKTDLYYTIAAKKSYIPVRKIQIFNSKTSKLWATINHKNWKPIQQIARDLIVNKYKREVDKGGINGLQILVGVVLLPVIAILLPLAIILVLLPILGIFVGEDFGDSFELLASAGELFSSIGGGIIDLVDEENLRMVRDAEEYVNKILK